jgi:2-keto-3-deoxy-L-rhamnonate aldolase RhmA/quercetin dioxygenase-like cupin family protein
MNVAALRKFRQKLASDQSVHGLWVTLESASVTEMAVALGLDWVVVDAEHGHLDWQEIAGHVRGAVRSDTVVLVRTAELNAGQIKRALDIGADGVVIPWIESAEQLTQAVAFAKYPPEGVRGIGGERATGWGQAMAEHTAEANDHVLVVPMMESVAAGRSIESLCAVEGVELFFFGPADYSSTAGYRGAWEGPGIAAELLSIKDRIRASGKYCGIMGASAENMLERHLQGFRMLALGSDTGLMLRSAHAALGLAGQDRPIRAHLAPEASPLPATPLMRPPETFRPDRPEAMSAVGANPGIDLAPGVTFDCLVGAQVGARDLTTGLVKFAPAAELPGHTHPFVEVISVLSGSLAISVEGRTYTLGPLDTIAIPARLAHKAHNDSPTATAVLHAAFPTVAVSRDLDTRDFPEQPMPSTSAGVAGKEHVVRFAAATKFEAGPGTRFVDYVNRSLVPGINLCGGYGLFQPGGRLPAHVHDFDESICIIQGEATCVVEGRRYRMANCATALQPRGRVHYFVNESQAPMAMIWIYAGPNPERIVVDERCATTAGNPWA